MTTRIQRCFALRLNFTAGEEVVVRHQYSTLRPLLWRLHFRFS